MTQGDAEALAAGSCLHLGLLASSIASLQAPPAARAIACDPRVLCSNLPSFPHFTPSKAACVPWPARPLPEI